MTKVWICPRKPGQFLQSTRMAFVVLTALCVVGIGASLARGKMRR